MKPTRSVAVLAALAASAMAAALMTSAPASGVKPNVPSGKPPQRVLIVLFDQMLPQYANEFNMPNFRSVRDHGRSFSNAYLGYMASETVIAHNVISSGLLPKHMGYTDEAYRDAGDLFHKGANAMHITGDFSLADFGTVQKNNGASYPKLADYVDAARPGTKFITVGEKSYAVETAAAKGGPNDIAVRLGSRKAAYNANVDPNPNPTGCANLGGAWRGPAGKNVPSYISARDVTDPSLCGRFFINSDKGNDYGTKSQFPSWLYPEEGNRFVPGNDPAHLGGDTWVADAAISMMQNEPWGGMFVTLGAIDKMGHMWGAQADVAPTDCTALNAMVHVKCAAENADVQLGKLLAEVDQVDAARGGKTLVVLTADHGATYGANFYGKTTAGASDSNWYYAPADLGVYDAGAGAGAPDTDTYSHPSADVAATLDDGNLQFSYQSTAIESWLRDHSDAMKMAGADNMLAMPGVIASYWRDGDHYVLDDTNSMSTSEQAWWTLHGQEIVDSMAAPDGPDVIGLEHDRTSYGVYGDHGGAQESVQRVPMVFWIPGMQKGASTRTFRTTDLMPTILSAMGITQTDATDGLARSLVLP